MFLTFASPSPKPREPKVGLTGNLGIERRNCRWIQGDRYDSGDGDETNGRISWTAIAVSCGEGRSDLPFLPSRILARTGLRLEPVLFKPFHPHILPHQVSHLCRAYQSLDTDYFQVREVAAIPLSPPKRSFLPGIDADVIYSQLHRFGLRPRSVLQRTRAQGQQTSAKGCTSRVFTGVLHPRPSLHPV